MIQFYVGDGKGKTTAAIGLAVRAVGAGKRVAFVQFDKGEDPGGKGYSERGVLESLRDVELHATGCDRRAPDGTFRTTVSDEDRAEARRGLEIVKKLLDEGKHDLISAYETVGGKMLCAEITAVDWDEEVLRALLNAAIQKSIDKGLNKLVLGMQENHPLPVLLR